MFTIQRISEIGGPQIANSTKIKDILAHNTLSSDLEGLECSERSENLINRKIGIFYFENISFFFHTQKNIRVENVVF